MLTKEERDEMLSKMRTARDLFRVTGDTGTLTMRLDEFGALLDALDKMETERDALRCAATVDPRCHVCGAEMGVHGCTGEGCAEVYDLVERQRDEARDALDEMEERNDVQVGLIQDARAKQERAEQELGRQRRKWAAERQALEAERDELRELLRMERSACYVAEQAADVAIAIKEKAQRERDEARSKMQLLDTRLKWFEDTDLARAYQEILCTRSERDQALSRAEVATGAWNTLNERAKALERERDEIVLRWTDLADEYLGERDEARQVARELLAILREPDEHTHTERRERLDRAVRAWGDEK